MVVMSSKVTENGRAETTRSLSNVNRQRSDLRQYHDSNFETAETKSVNSESDLATASFFRQLLGQKRDFCLRNNTDSMTNKNHQTDYFRVSQRLIILISFPDSLNSTSSINA